MDELKPCPFCGSSNIDGIVETNSIRAMTAKIWCDDCGAEIVRWSKKAVVDAWNRRSKDGDTSD